MIEGVMSTFRRGRRQVEWGWIGDGVGGLWIASTILRLDYGDFTITTPYPACRRISVVAFKRLKKGRNVTADALVSIFVDLVLVLRIWFHIYCRDL